MNGKPKPASRAGAGSRPRSSSGPGRARAGWRCSSPARGRSTSACSASWPAGFPRMQAALARTNESAARRSCRRCPTGSIRPRRSTTATGSAARTGPARHPVRPAGDRGGQPGAAAGPRGVRRPARPGRRAQLRRADRAVRGRPDRRPRAGAAGPAPRRDHGRLRRRRRRARCSRSSPRSSRSPACSASMRWTSSSPTRTPRGSASCPGRPPRSSAAARLLADRGITTRLVPVSAAFHSRSSPAPRRRSARRSTRSHSPPSAVPVFANTTAAPYPDDPDAARDLLAGQLARPVEFVAQVEAMYRMGARTFLEVGPDARLTGLVRRSSRAATTSPSPWTPRAEPPATCRPGLRARNLGLAWVCC